MKRFLAATLLSLVSVGQASVILPYQKALDLLQTAQKRVLVYAPQMTDVAFANALRVKALEGVPVVLVTIPFFSFQPESTTNSLALVGIKVYEAQVDSTRSVLVIDDKVFVANGLGRGNVPVNYLGNSAGTLNSTVKWFQKVSKSATPVRFIDAANRIRGMQK